MVWLAILLMTALVLAALLLPLLRRQDTQVSREILESAVHRDRLAEVKRDLDRGLLTAAEAEAAETEISRLMLAAAQDAKSGGSKGRDKPLPRKIAAALVTGIVPIGGLLLYLNIGAPEEPGYPLAARTDTTRPPVAEHEGGGELGPLIEQLAERMEQDPDNLEGWVLLGRSAYSAGQYRRAVAAFREARRLAGSGDPGIDGLYGEALVAVAQGIVTAEARRVFEGLAAADPGNLGARYYVGLARVQAGEPRAALETWAAVLAEAPPGTPWIADLQAMMERLASEQGIDLAAITPQTPTAPTAPGPTAEDVQAAQSMSAGDRNEMIRSMVARLAERLEDNPGDAQGWLRLGRSYLVLGETAKAREALDRAVAAGAVLPADLAGQVSNGAERAEGEAGAGPSREEVAAALEAPPEDREAMIRGMVANLAERLEDSPDDFQGWMRLGRSYSVLGEADKAKSALARAVAIEPGNIDAVIAYSGATLVAPDTPEELPGDSVSAMRGLLDEDPRSPPALWYVGLAEAQDGNAERAAALWGRLLVQLDPASREYGTVKSRLETLTW